MSTTLLVIGIIVTSIALLAMTVFSISNFILKRIYKEEMKQKTKEEKQKEKHFKRALKAIKKVIKFINRKLLNNYLAFYGIASVSLVGGIAMTTVGTVQVVQEKNAAVISSSEVSSSSSSSLEESSLESIISSSESSSEVSSESSSESNTESSSGESSSESSSSSSSAPAPIEMYTINFYNGTELHVIEEVIKGGKALKPEDPSREYHSFDNWYIDQNFGQVFDFDTPITANLDLYAHFTKLTYHVYFKEPSETRDIDITTAQVVSAGKYAHDPNIYPVATNDKIKYVWYTTLACEEGDEFDFINTIITSDLILYGVQKEVD